MVLVDGSTHTKELPWLKSTKSFKINVTEPDVEACVYDLWISKKYQRVFISGHNCGWKSSVFNYHKGHFVVWLTYAKYIDIELTVWKSLGVDLHFHRLILASRNKISDLCFKKRSQMVLNNLFRSILIKGSCDTRKYLGRSSSSLLPPPRLPSKHLSSMWRVHSTATKHLSSIIGMGLADLHR